MLKNKFDNFLAAIGKSSAPRPVWREDTSTFELCLPAGWPDTDAAIEWCQRNGSGGVEQSGSTDDILSLKELALDRSVYVWSSPVDTLLLTTSIPTRNRKKLLKALPYALEDQLLGNPESQHYVSDAAENGKLAVAVTEKKRLSSWVKALKSAGLAPVCLAPANMALPFQQDKWHLLFVGKSCWLRTNQLGGTSFPSAPQPPVVMSAVLKESRSEHHAPQSMDVINVPADIEVQEWANALDLTLNPDSRDFWVDVCPANCSINFLQGEYVPERPTTAGLTRFRPALALFAVWLFGSLVFGIWEWSSLSRDYTKIKGDMVQVFRQSFPEAKAIVDPVLQMQRKFDELSGHSGGFKNSDFIALLAKSAPALQGTSDVKLSTVSFDKQGLQINLHLPDFQTLESLKNRLEAAGLKVDVIRSNSSGSGVDGSLRISVG